MHVSLRVEEGTRVGWSYSMFPSSGFERVSRVKLIASSLGAQTRLRRSPQIRKSRSKRSCPVKLRRALRPPSGLISRTGSHVPPQPAPSTA